MFANIVTRVRADPCWPRCETNQIIVKIRVPLPKALSFTTSRTSIVEETKAIVTYTTKNDDFSCNIVCDEIVQNSHIVKKTPQTTEPLESVQTISKVSSPTELPELKNPINFVPTQVSVLSDLEDTLGLTSMIGEHNTDVTKLEIVTSQLNVNNEQLLNPITAQSQCNDSTADLNEMREPLSTHQTSVALSGNLSERNVLPVVLRPGDSKKQNVVSDEQLGFVCKDHSTRQNVQSACALISTPLSASVPKPLSTYALKTVFSSVANPVQSQFQSKSSVAPCTPKLVNIPPDCGVTTKPTVSPLNVTNAFNSDSKSDIKKSGGKLVCVVINGTKYFVNIDAKKRSNPSSLVHITDKECAKEALQRLETQNELTLESPLPCCHNSDENITENTAVSENSTESKCEIESLEQEREKMGPEEGTGIIPTNDHAYLEVGHENEGKAHKGMEVGHSSKGHDIMELGQQTHEQDEKITNKKGHGVTHQGHMITESNDHNICFLQNRIVDQFAIMDEKLNDSAIIVSDVISPKRKRARNDDSAKTSVLHQPATRLNLICDICDEVFGSYDRMLRHKDSHFQTRKNYTCSACGETFHQTFYHFQLHSDDCSRRFELKKAQENGKNIILSQQNRCEMCLEEFDSRPAFYEHMSSVHRESRDFVCDSCGTTMCTVESEFQTHVGLCTAKNKALSDTEDKAIDNMALPCHLCDKTFKGEVYLKRHIRRHTSVGHKCKFCGKSYAQKRYVEMHIQRAHGNIAETENNKYRSKNYACKFCDYKAYSTQAVRVHERNHTGEKPFSCHKCTKSFITKAGLSAHLNQHAGFKPYRCQFCAEKFFSKETRQRHEADHTGEK